MSLIFSYWGDTAKTMAWLDSPPCGNEACMDSAGRAVISELSTSAQISTCNATEAEEELEEEQQQEEEEAPAKADALESTLGSTTPSTTLPQQPLPQPLPRAGAIAT